MRVFNSKIEIVESDAINFFEKRGQAISTNTSLSKTMLQDKSPEVAIQRDLIEKERVIPLLGLSSSDNVLDIGCGDGRWCKSILPIVSFYTGVDASQSLICNAKSNFAQSNCDFIVARSDQLKHKVNGKKFSLFIVSGILIYLNDKHVVDVLEYIENNSVFGSRIYLREPVSVNERLTLSGHWSEELCDNYNAIYRTTSELDCFLQDYCPSFKKTIPFQPLYSCKELNNRKETIQYFCLLRRCL